SMQKINVAVICGGFTAEQNISLLSGDVVYKNLDPDKFNPYKVVISKNEWRVEPFNTAINLHNFTFIMGAETIQLHAAFIAVHGSPGEDGCLQGYFDMKGIPYTNCGVFASAVTFNKFFCKEALRQLQIPMAKGILVRKNADLNSSLKEIHQLQLPVFVKPNNNGSSYGVSKIADAAQMETALLHAFEFDQEVLIEEGVQGVEVTCGVYSHKGKIISLPICEVVSGSHDFFDYTAKYTAGESDEIIPARIPEEIASTVARYSEMIYTYLGCKGVIRIDYILQEEKPYFLEVNTVPGLSESSIIPKMVQAAGMRLSDFLSILIAESL
ncbi:MAG: D-alanine--D-alanine ligase, partial [Chitinophagales bacterium]